jgi:hypothetical protein
LRLVPGLARGECPNASHELVISRIRLVISIGGGRR